jgi:hypothetical protein
VYVKVCVVVNPTRSIAVRTIECGELSGVVGIRKPGSLVVPSTFAVHEATPDALSAQRNASGIPPFSGAVAPGWSSTTVRSRLSTGAGSVAS